VTESAFQAAAARRLALMGRRVLRVSDRADAKHGVYGLRALTLPRIDSTGADLLVLPITGIRCVVARSSLDIQQAVEDNAGPFFLELKEPKAKHRRDQLEQMEWIRWVQGGRR
jgi:hypothetical protein